MKLYDVSQLPVIENRNIVGFIDESDILLAVAKSNDRFNKPVNTAMVTELAMVEVNDPIDKLMPIFNKDYVAIVKDGGRFLGLITRVDLLNYLRRKADY
jgi:cystathionine beta-synthase